MTHSSLRLRPQRMASKGFTLVELLVVIAIIALLMTMLIPVLSMAKEAGRIGVCTSNLRSWGMVSHAHAEEHDSLLPQSLMLHQNLYCLPSYIDNDSDPNDDRDGIGGWYPGSDYWYRWKRGGTPWTTFRRLGLEVGMAVCPSTDWEVGSNRYNAESNEFVDKYFNQTSSWGHRIQTSYMLMVNVQRTMGPLNTNWFGDRVPAKSIEDGHLAEKVIAADEVLVQWDHTSYINHRSPYWFESPESQNLLYGDGHVDHETYETDVNVRSNYNLRHNSGTWAGYSFWGGRQ